MKEAGEAKVELIASQVRNRKTEGNNIIVTHHQE